MRICPKCGGQHENCEIKDYVCLNCKGPHLVLDKQCPLYIKEKNIRAIMAKENATYRKAVEIYYNSSKKINTNIQKEINTNIQEFNQSSTHMTTPELDSSVETYSYIVAKNGVKGNTADRPTKINPSSKKGRDISPSQRKKQKEKPSSTEELPMTTQEDWTDINDEGNNRNKIVDKYRFDFKKFILKLKNVILSERSLEEKIVACIKLIYDDVKKCIFSLFNNVNSIQYLLSMFNG